MEDATLRPAPSAAVAVGWPWLLISALFGVAAIDGHASLWIVSGLCLAVFVIAFMWVLSHKLVIQDNVLHYKALLHAPVSIDIEEIAAVRSKVGVEEYSDRTLPTVRIEIVPIEGSSAASFVINRKVFRKDEINGFLKAIADKQN